MGQIGPIGRAAADKKKTCRGGESLVSRPRDCRLPSTGLPKSKFGSWLGSNLTAWSNCCHAHPTAMHLVKGSRTSDSCQIGRLSMRFGNFLKICIWPFSSRSILRGEFVGMVAGRAMAAQCTVAHGQWTRRERKTVLFDESASKAHNAAQARLASGLRGFAISGGKHARVILKGRWRFVRSVYGPNS